VEVIRFEEARVSNLKVHEELDLFGDIGHVLAVQVEVAAQEPLHRMELDRCDEVEVGSLAARKAAVDIVALIKLSSKSLFTK